MGTNFQSIITEFDNDFTRKILGQTFSNESIVSQKLFCTSITNTEFKNCRFENVDFTGSYFGTCSFYETNISDIDFTGAIIDNLVLKETTFSNLKVSETFPVKFSKSGKLTEVTDSWSLENVINSIR